jgi:Bacterial Ig-like domain (group 3)
VDVPPSSLFFTGTARAQFSNVTLPAGTRSFSAQYDGDEVYQPGSVVGAGTVTVDKGTVGFALTAGKPAYTVGEQITLSARITHPKVVGATPTGQIARASGPSPFQGAAVGADAGDTGTIDTNLPVTGFPAPGNFTVTMTYSGDTNFQSATAGAILTVAKAVPQIVLIPPAQVVAGQEVVFTVRAAAPSNLAFRPLVSGQVSLTGVANGATASLVPNPGSSIATLRQTFPTAGTFSIGVQYGGDANFQSATSAPIQLVVQ